MVLRGRWGRKSVSGVRVRSGGELDVDESVILRYVGLVLCFQACRPPPSLVTLCDSEYKPSVGLSQGSLRSPRQGWAPIP